MTNIKQKISVVAIGLVVAVVLGTTAVKAFSGSSEPSPAQIIVESGASVTVNIPASSNDEMSLGAFSGILDTRLTTGEATAWNDGQFDDLVVEDDLWIDGDVIVSTSLGFKELTESYTLAATNTVAESESGKTIYISGSSTLHVLPTPTTTGQILRFVVGDALAITTTVQTAGGGNLIEGSLVVDGTAVDCDAEDTITFGASFEDIGDFIELRSSGSYWMLTGIGEAASSIACSAT